MEEEGMVIKFSYFTAQAILAVCVVKLKRGVNQRC